jgi:hypothetical protein
MYYATLHQKQGEMRALRMLEEFGNNIEKFTPNIIINDASQETLNLIRKSYSHFVLLDVRNLDTDEIDTLEELLNLPENEDFSILYPIEYLVDGLSLKKDSHVRIDKSIVNAFFVQWLDSNHEKLPEKIMLDFGYIESVSNDLISSIAPILRLLEGKSVIVMSGAVPNSIPVASDKNYKFPRIEKDLFNEIKKVASKDTDLSFGDYSSVSPVITAGGRAIVQIKYTLDNDYWFVRNGQRRGNYDFVKVCQQIANLSEFDEKYCWGDKYIKSVVDDDTNKGNPSVWTSIGVNRHTVVCLNEL